MSASQLKTKPSKDTHTLGDLVYVAGEMYVFTGVLGDVDHTMFAMPQLGLVVNTAPNTLLIWFAEFGVHKEKEHIFACAPLDQPTTKIWPVNS